MEVSEEIIETFGVQLVEELGIEPDDLASGQDLRKRPLELPFDWVRNLLECWLMKRDMDLVRSILLRLEEGKVDEQKWLEDDVIEGYSAR